MERFVRFVLQHPIVTVFTIVSFSMIFSYGLFRLKVESGYLSFLPADHPTLNKLNDVRDLYGTGTPLLAAWSCQESSGCNSALDDQSLRMAWELSQKIAELPYVLGIDSPASTPLVHSDADGIEVIRFVEANGVLNPDRNALRVNAKNNKQWAGWIISEDANVGALIVHLEDASSEANREVYHGVREELKAYEGQFQFHIAGDPVFYAGMTEMVDRQMLFLMPLMVGALALFLYLSFRSWIAVVAPMAMIGLTFTWSQGLLGLLNWPLSVLTQSIPTILIALLISDSVHLLAHYTRHCKTLPPNESRADRTTVILRAVRECGGPCLLASLTTIGGFLAFYRSTSPKFQEFAICATFGISVALLLTFSLLPLFLAYIPSKKLRQSSYENNQSWDTILNSVSIFIHRYANAIVALSVLLLCAGVYGYQSLRIDLDQYHLLGPDSRISQDVRWMSDHYRKIENLEVSFELPPCENLSNPDCVLAEDPSTLQFLDDFSRHLQSLDGVGRTLSLTDLVQHTNQLLHKGTLSDQQAIASTKSNAEALALLSLFEDDTTSSWMSFNRRNLRVLAETETLLTTKRYAIIQAVDRYLETHLPDGWSYFVTGSLQAYGDTMTTMLETEIASFRQALFNVGMLMTLFFFSLLWAAVGLLPTILPVLCVLGFCGATGIFLDVSTVMLAPVVLGIGSDDSIHLIYAYKQARKTGLGKNESVKACIHGVGRSVTITSLVLAAGFGALSASSMPVIAGVAGLIALAVILALLFDLLLLPAILVVSSRITAKVSRPKNMFLLIMPLFLAFPSQANSEQCTSLSPDARFQKALKLRYGYDVQWIINMFVRDYHSSKAPDITGNELRYSLNVMSTHNENGFQQSLAEFIEPLYLRGFLIRTDERADDNYVVVYRRETNRPRRVRGGRKADRFWGSDFTYEDFDRIRASHYQISGGNTTQIEEEQVHVVKAIPTEDSAYSRIDFHIADLDCAILEQHYYRHNRQEAIKKLISPRDGLRSFGAYLIPTQAILRDYQRGSETELYFSEVTINPTMPASLFTDTTLTKGKSLPRWPSNLDHYSTSP